MLKKRAAQQEWLYPEKDESINWQNVKATLLPLSNKIHEFGGEILMVSAMERHFQDAYGRTTHEADFLKKEVSKNGAGAK